MLDEPDEPDEPIPDVADLRLRDERGDAEAQAILGGAYANGHAVPQDYVQAVAWYRKAAAQGPFADDWRR